MERPRTAQLCIVSAVVISISCFHALGPNAFACEPDCGSCMHWHGPVPGGYCEVNHDGSTCGLDSECGMCGICDGTPCY